MFLKIYARGVEILGASADVNDAPEDCQDASVFSFLSPKKMEMAFSIFDFSVFYFSRHSSIVMLVKLKVF